MAAVLRSVGERGRLPHRLAHRGDWRHATENSLAAMEAALGVAGCDGLEFDVRASSDGVAVLLHDATLRRVQRLARRCADLTADELATHGIPAFADLLDLVDTDTFLDVELKEPVAGAIDLLERKRGRTDGDGRPTLHAAVVSSFQPTILRWLADRYPTWPRWLNAHRLSPTTIERAVRLGCVAISVEWHAIDDASLARVRARGLEVAAWTVREAADYERLERSGLVAICAEAAALGA
jgi:glycerophosphoryl diester phosphodiesterase